MSHKITSPYGQAVRVARNMFGVTLADMHSKIGASIAFLGSTESGKSSIPMKHVDVVETYFREQHRYTFTQSLKSLAMQSNGKILLTGLDNEQRATICDIACATIDGNITQEEWATLTKIQQSILKRRLKRQAVKSQ